MLTSALSACALVGEQAPTLATEVIARGLRVPWALAFALDGRLFLTEEVEGRLRVLLPEGGGFKLQEQPVLALPRPPAAPSVLRGLALDPDFSRNGYLYLVYTTGDPQGRLWNRLSRFTLREGRASDERVLLDTIPTAVTNFGGRVKFGPDGKLYLTTGYVNDFSLPQDRRSLAGKLLRLNPDGSVPADNPFPGSPVYSLGHRNSQGLAWHPATRQLFATEHGPTGEMGNCCHDEVNRIVPGGNYGWPEALGAPGDPRFIDPVLQSGQDTWAPAGADFYRGPFTAWKGDLFFTALRGMHLHRVRLKAPAYREVERHEQLLQGEYGRLRDVAQGPDGCLYVATSNTDGRTNAVAGPEDDRILRVCPR